MNGGRTRSKLDLAINFRRGTKNVHEADNKVWEQDRDPEVPYIPMSWKRGSVTGGTEATDQGANGSS